MNEPAQEKTMHTPEPWHYQEDSDAYTHIVRAGDRFIVQLTQDTSGVSEANARRIVAAVNFAQGFTSLPPNGLAEVVSALKDWLYYAENALREFDLPDDSCDPEASLCPRCVVAGCIQLKIRNARAALAGLEGR